MKKLHFSLALILVTGCTLAQADEVMIERKEKVQENIEEEKRADEAIEEEQSNDLSEYENPYVRINPKSKKNFFEEMQSDESHSSGPAL